MNRTFAWITWWSEINFDIQYDEQIVYHQNIKRLDTSHTTTIITQMINLKGKISAINKVIKILEEEFGRWYFWLCGVHVWEWRR